MELALLCVANADDTHSELIYQNDHHEIPFRACNMIFPHELFTFNILFYLLIPLQKIFLAVYIVKYTYAINNIIPSRTTLLWVYYLV